jgi:putative hydrolase of the HAD superfamily
MAQSKFHILYSDIGGVLGTNGWDTHLRHRIAEHFRVESHEIEARHALTFDTYERGFLSFEKYLDYVFFASPRPFTLEQVRDYAYNASTPWPQNIQFYGAVKAANQLKLALISNEGSGLTQHRVRKFGLRDLADFLVFSYATHMRKPDPEIWRIALELAQASPEESIYIDDRKMFVDVAAEHGFTAIHYTSLEELGRQLSKLGLIVP